MIEKTKTVLRARGPASSVRRLLIRFFNRGQHQPTFFKFCLRIGWRGFLRGHINKKWLIPPTAIWPLPWPVIESSYFTSQKRLDFTECFSFESIQSKFQGQLRFCGFINKNNQPFSPNRRNFDTFRGQIWKAIQTYCQKKTLWDFIVNEIRDAQDALDDMEWVDTVCFTRMSGYCGCYRLVRLLHIHQGISVIRNGLKHSKPPEMESSRSVGVPRYPVYLSTISDGWETRILKKSRLPSDNCPNLSNQVGERALKSLKIELGTILSWHQKKTHSFLNFLYFRRTNNWDLRS